MPLVDHVDLVVSSIERSLPFYRGLLAPLGWVVVAKQEGERGETIHYLGGPDWEGSLGLRERSADAGRHAVDRYAVGLHHVAFGAPNRAAVDEAARWLRDRDVEIEGGPGERHYTPGTTRCSSTTPTASSSRWCTGRGRSRSPSRAAW